MQKRKPSYRLHKASKQAIVTLSGQMYYLGEFGSPESKQRYLQLIGEWDENGQMIAAGHYKNGKRVR